jgi:TonB family protein
VLRATGAILHNNFRGGDFIFRYGGDEFVVLLPGADAGEAMALGERARTAMLEAEFFAPEEQQRIEIPVSFSIGVAAYPGDGESGKSVLARADERLYLEKQAFKSRIRRRRALISVVAVALVVAVVLAVFRWLPRSPGKVADPPPSASVSASTVILPASSEDEALLLARITELQAEISRLTEERKGQRAPESGARGAEIESLQSQVRQLSDRLEARSSGGSATAPDVSRQNGDRPTPERPAADFEPQERPAAPATSPAGSRAETVEVSLPRLLEPVTPRYPSMALERRLEATIEFRVLIDESGRVVNATPVGPPKGLGFDEAARAAALASRWSPGTHAGEAVPMETKLVVQFRIRS